MWKATAVFAALFVGIMVLTILQNGHPGMDPKMELMFEKQRAARMVALQHSGVAMPAPLACAATRVSEATVQTLYLVWINRRSEFSSPAERDSATADLSRAITGCGGNPASLENAAHLLGLDLEEQAALAMLEAKRA